MSIQLDVPSWDDGDDGAGAAVIAPTKALRPATSFGSGGVGFGGFGGVGTRDPAAMRKEETKKKKKKKKGKEPKHAVSLDYTCLLAVQPDRIPVFVSWSLLTVLRRLTSRHTLCKPYPCNSA